MRPSRLGRIAVLLLAGLALCQPGITDVLELGSAAGDCSEPCAGDGSGGTCSSSCDECTCCPRAMSALLTAPAVPEGPRRVEADAVVLPARQPLVFVLGVFHPPRG